MKKKNKNDTEQPAENSFDRLVKLYWQEVDRQGALERAAAKPTKHKSKGIDIVASPKSYDKQ